MRRIDEFTLSILSRGTVEGNVVKLPVGQLDRADYARVDKALKGLGGKWDRKAGGHVFPFDPRNLLGQAVETGSYSDRKQDGQMFWTPEPLAERMADMARIQPGDLVLEPSAGTGRIVAPLIARGAKVVAVETDAANIKELRRLPVESAYQMDFMLWYLDDRRTFNAVVMNPPFTKGQDVAHIRAAWTLLRPGGRLVAICAEGPFYRESKADREFRAWLGSISAISEQLPSGTFKKSGTNVATRLIFATRHSGRS